MRKQIYLIQPTYRDARGRLLQGKRMPYASLALPALSTTVPASWEKEFCLEYFDDVNYETDASVIGISSMGYDILHGMEIAREFKRRGKRVLFGGPQARLTMERLGPVADAIVHGHPGPREMSGILQDALEGKLSAEYHCGVHLNYPFDYSVLQRAQLDFTPVLMGVGCRWNCTFCCTAALHEGSYRLRNLQHVIADLGSVCRTSRKAVFVDANIYNNRGYLLRLCRRIREMDGGLHWGAQCTVDIGDDEEVLDGLRAAGCLLLILGLETLGQANLDQVGKPVRADLHRERVKRIRDAGIAVGGYFILGLDGDTAESFDAVFDFIHDGGIALPVLNLLLPAPGTRMFDQLKREHRLLVDDEEDFLVNNTLYATACNRSFYVPKNMTAAEAEEKFTKLYARLSSFREILRRSITSSPTLTAALFALNCAMRREYRAMVAEGGCRRTPAVSRGETPADLQPSWRDGCR